MSRVCLEVSEDAPSVCLLPWRENPYRMMTLWDMLQLYADIFVRMLHDLKHAELELSGAIDTRGSDEEQIERMATLSRSLASLNQHCKHLQLRSANKQIRTMAAFYSEKSFDVGESCRMLKEFRNRIQEDLEETVMYALEPSKVDLFYARPSTGVLQGKLVRLPPEMLWGHEVCSNFKSAVRDIGDANQCLSFEKGTACVFHIMRVMEVGLRALGKSLNNPKLDPKSNPSWESILKKCDEELAKPHAQRSQEWQQASSFYGEATANLRAVKDAWRNPTMHVEKDYDYEEALHVWRTARAFMKHLATNTGE